MTPHAFGEKVAWSALAKRLGRAFTSSPVTLATNKLPQKYQPAVHNARRAFNYGMLGATGYGAYRGAQTVAGDMATAAAQQIVGVNDANALQEVNTRAQQNALPMLYRAVMPAALGGDNTTIGQNVAKSFGTAAYHNLRPATFLPGRNPTKLQYATSSPAINVLKHVLPKRPTGTQMLANIPQKDQQNIAAALTSAVLAPASAGPLAKTLQHVFEPAVNHKQRQILATFGVK